jgi:hypothetical protein
MVNNQFQMKNNKQISTDYRTINLLETLQGNNNKTR